MMTMGVWESLRGQVQRRLNETMKTLHLINLMFITEGVTLNKKNCK